MLLLINIVKQNSKTFLKTTYTSETNINNYLILETKLKKYYNFILTLNIKKKTSKVTIKRNKYKITCLINVYLFRYIHFLTFFFARQLFEQKFLR